MASGRCMNKLVELLVEAVVKEAAQVDDVRENSKVIAMKPSTPVCQECVELRLGVPGLCLDEARTRDNGLKIRVSVVRFRPWPPINQRFRVIESTSSVDWPAGLPNPTGFLRVHRPASGTFERLAELFEVLHGAVYPPPSRCAWVGRH